MTKKPKTLRINWSRYRRTIVFIDNANIIHALSTLGWKLDHKKLKGYFEKYTRLKGVYLYSAFIGKKIEQQTFLEMISRIGLILRTKEVKFIHQKDGTMILKGDMDIEIAIDMFESLKKFDTAVLLSGDSDFAPLLDWLHTKGKKAVIISTKYHVAKELIKASNLYINLRDLRSKWELVKSKNPAKRRGSG